MKNPTPASRTKPAAETSAPEKAIGGQPENDHDAREAGLSSATSAKAGAQANRAEPPKPGKASKRR